MPDWLPDSLLNFGVRMCRITGRVWRNPSLWRCSPDSLYNPTNVKTNHQSPTPFSPSAIELYTVKVTKYFVERMCAPARHCVVWQDTVSSSQSIHIWKCDKNPGSHTHHRVDNGYLQIRNKMLCELDKDTCHFNSHTQTWSI